MNAEPCVDAYKASLSNVFKLLSEGEDILMDRTTRGVIEVFYVISTLLARRKSQSLAMSHPEFL
jgi:hypothetical protein